LSGSAPRTRTRFERLCLALTAPALRTGDAELERKIATIVLFTLSGMAIFAAFSLMVYRQANYAAAAFHASVVVTYGLGLGLVRAGAPVPGMYFNIAATAAGIWAAMWFGGGLGAPAVVFVATLPTVGFLSLGRRAGIYGAALGLGVIGVTVALEALGFEPRHDPPRVEYAKRIVESVVIVLEMYVLSLAFQNLTDRAYTMLASKRDELAGLFNSMRQGVLAFDDKGRIVGEHSAQATHIFGREDLDGVSIIELLYEGAPSYELERDLFESFIDTAFSLGRAGFQAVVEMAPEKRVLHEGSEREQHLSLEFRPVFDGEKLSRVMMLVTDETEQVNLQRQVDQDRVDRERLQVRLQRLAVAGAHTFVAFLSSSRTRIAEMKAAARRGTSTLTQADVQQFFRHAHTIRGEAKAFDLVSIERPMERIEAILRELSKHGADNDVTPPAKLAPLLDESERAVVDAEHKLVELSPIGDAILDQVTVSRRDLDLLTAQLAKVARDPLDRDVMHGLHDVAQRLSSRPFGELAGQFSDAVQRWAEQSGKQVRYEVTGKRCPIEPNLAQALPRALAHLLRNAVAHGIEPKEARERVGKPTQGLLAVSAEERDGLVVIQVADDGAGLDEEALRALARRLGLTPDDPKALIFENGVSTSRSVDSLSGLGIGMGAAKRTLEEVGYTLALEPSQAGASFVIRKARKPVKGALKAC
jgi:signal transduction histidine kinase